MSTVETIDVLCKVTSELADIVYKQACLLMQAEFDTEELKAKREAVGRQLDMMEFNLRDGIITGFDDA